MKHPEQLALDNVAEWIQQNTPEDQGLLLPVSGGSDSALAAYVCGQAGVERVTGIYFGNDLLRSREWFEAQIPVEVIDLDNSVLDPEVARWANVLSRGLVEHEIVIGTRNRTENVLGTYSAVSRVASMLPLVGIWKSDVIKLCEYIGVPSEIIESSKQADDDCGRPDSLAAISFDDLDMFLKVKIGELSSDTELAIGEDERTYLELVLEKYDFKKRLPYFGPEVII